jgi:hypothetical protein
LAEGHVNSEKFSKVLIDLVVFKLFYSF